MKHQEYGICIPLVMSCLTYGATSKAQNMESGFGIAGKEVSQVEKPGHQVQVWQILPEFVQKARYSLSIKHAVAGAKGSFFLVAWADTNNDGTPDKEIGRSALMTASSAGDWSSWEFSANYERIFVGNCWTQPDEQIFYQQGGKLEGYQGLGTNVFYSRQFNGVPNASTGPRFTNIRLTVLGE